MAGQLMRVWSSIIFHTFAGHTVRWVRSCPNFASNTPCDACFLRQVVPWLSLSELFACTLSYALSGLAACLCGPCLLFFGAYSFCDGVCQSCPGWCPHSICLGLALPPLQVVIRKHRVLPLLPGSLPLRVLRSRHFLICGTCWYAYGSLLWLCADYSIVSAPGFVHSWAQPLCLCCLWLWICALFLLFQ